MRRLRVIEFLSLDGVMQAPGDPKEDTEGGFQHGGWALPYQDEAFGAKAAEQMAHTDTYLFGRRTYEIFAAYWPNAPEEIPFTEPLNSTRKYVASRTLQEATWQNSSIISGDIAEEVGTLKDAPGNNIAVLGSGELVQSLMTHDLVDEFYLTIFPLVLGTGKRLFRNSDQMKKFRLQDSTTTSTGGLILSLEPDR